MGRARLPCFEKFDVPLWEPGLLQLPLNSYLRTIYGTEFTENRDLSLPFQRIPQHLAGRDIYFVYLMNRTVYYGLL